jgi:hypothetical protein
MLSNLNFKYNKELVITSYSFIVPLIILHQQKTHIPLFFTNSIILQSFVSCLLWWNPMYTRWSLIHKFDALLARINILLIIFFKLFIYQKNIVIFKINTLIMLYLFYKSNQASRQIWCSQIHIIYHGFAHLFGAGSIYLAFRA